MTAPFWGVVREDYRQTVKWTTTGKGDILGLRAVVFDYGMVLTGPRDPERLPSQLIRPANGKLLFLLDEAAAAKLPPASEVFERDGYKVGRLEI